jgi:urease accessory protein
MGLVVPLRRAIAVSRAGAWPEKDAEATVTLAFSDRHRRRFRLTDDLGRPFLLDLPTATRLAEGDGLELAGGGWLRVVAADEPVATIRASTARRIARIAWHLGNRHTPVEVRADGSLRILDDHVLVAMVEGLGGRVTRSQDSFNPEAGAYAGGGHGHHHDHGHDHGHDQHHRHDHGHDDGDVGGHNDAR